MIVGDKNPRLTGKRKCWAQTFLSVPKANRRVANWPNCLGSNPSAHLSKLTVGVSKNFFEFGIRLVTYTVGIMAIMLGVMDDVLWAIPMKLEADQHPFSSALA